MLLKTQKLIRLPIVLLTTWTLLFGFFCVGMFHEKSMSMDISNAQAMLSVQSGESCCGTTMSQHIESWGSTPLALPQGSRDSLVLFALGLALVFVYSWFSFRDRYPSLDPDVGRLRLYVQQNPDLILFNHLKLAFARGILNTKVY
jgi:hypothetical protein